MIMWSIKHQSQLFKWSYFLYYLQNYFLLKDARKWRSFHTSRDFIHLGTNACTNTPDSKFSIHLERADCALRPPSPRFTEAEALHLHSTPLHYTTLCKPEGGSLTYSPSPHRRRSMELGSPPLHSKVSVPIVVNSIFVSPYVLARSPLSPPPWSAPARLLRRPRPLAPFLLAAATVSHDPPLLWPCLPARLRPAPVHEREGSSLICSRPRTAARQHLLKKWNDDAAEWTPQNLPER
jgi:hypothetical protein